MSCGCMPVHSGTALTGEASNSSGTHHPDHYIRRLLYDKRDGKARLEVSLFSRSKEIGARRGRESGDERGSRGAASAVQEGGIASLIIERARRIRRFTAFAQCRSGCLATHGGRPSTSCIAAVVGDRPDLTRPAAYRRATPRRAALATGRLSGALQPRLPFLR